MFEELLFIMGFLLFSVVISYLLLTYTPDPLNKVIRALAIVGIIIHEVCHIVMCIITNTRVKKIRLLEKISDPKKKEKFDYQGHVTIKDDAKLTLLQAFLISFAPLYISFWIFFYLLEQILNAHIELWLFFVYIVIMISIMLYAAPSFVDLKCIPQAYKDDPRYSNYQIFLLVLSILSVWVITLTYNFTYFHEVLIYIFIMIVYYLLKYSFRGINAIIQHIYLRGDSSSTEKIKYKTFTRNRHKPLKPRRQGFEEAQF
jgi:hypothetical protein